MRPTMRNLWRASFSGLVLAVVAPTLGMAKPEAPLADQATLADADELIFRALQHRFKGEEDQARALLDQALELIPDYGPARSHLGEVRFQDRWLPLPEIEKQAAQNKDLASYTRMRDAYARVAELVWLTSRPAAAGVAMPRYTQAPLQSPRYLRRAFELPADANWAQFKMQVQGKAVVTINGQKLNDARPNQVAAQLKAGRNVVAISVRSSDDGSLEAKLAVGIRFWLEGTLGDGTIFAVGSDETWRVSAVESGDWLKSDFDDSAWENAVTTQEAFPGSESGSGPPQPTISALLEQALAKWCDAHHLPDQARFHWSRLLDFDPTQGEAMTALELVRYDDKLVHKDDVEELKRANRDAKTALARWQPILRKLRRELDSGEIKPAQAAERLKDADASSLAAFETVLNENTHRPGNSDFALVFIQHALARLPEHAATEVLVRLAVSHSEDSVREAAIKHLKPRDLLSFVPGLMAELKGPVTVETEIVVERNGSRPLVTVCNARYVRKGVEVDEASDESFRFVIVPVRVTEPRIALPIVVPAGGLGRGKVAGSIGTPLAPRQTPERAELEARKKAEAKQDDIVIAVAKLNDQTTLDNRLRIQLIKSLTGEDHGPNPLAWWNWWRVHNELLRPHAHRPHERGLNRHTEHCRWVIFSGPMSCFAKGTPVRTLTGLRAIETIKPGDLVLSQDPDTGELAYQLVVGTTIRPPSQTLSLEIGGERIVTTLGHRFWKNGQGWLMAKQLAIGDSLSTIDGPQSLSSIETGSDEPAYNLVVDRFSTYFVGAQDILVHDNAAPRPTTAIMPGLHRK